MSQTKDSFRLRKGQEELAIYLSGTSAFEPLSVQWPTGYGKSIGFALAWKHCVDSDIANRFLLIVANDTQRQQAASDFAGDCALVDAPCEGGIWEFKRAGRDILAASRGDAVIFVSTVQQLDACNRGGLNAIKDLLTTPGTRWLLGFDEFHHYGEQMSWGNAAKEAMRYADATVAMSATPYRRGADVIFPQPALRVSYTEAFEETAVKAMICHGYDYRVTVDTVNGPKTYTTTQLLGEAVEGIDGWEERQGVRYCTGYIQPLLVNPLGRLMEKRLASGERLQMLIRAMSCRHARFVSDQVRDIANGSFDIDWIGTGKHGRRDEDNARIRSLFCPAKVDGRRPSPSLDILVQVSMAGEGFDSINVVEIVDLFPVGAHAKGGRATADKQFYGRGSRIISGSEALPLHVSVPSDHPLYEWSGLPLHDWMDSVGDTIPVPDDGKPREPSEPDLFELPPLPRTRDIELLSITTEDDDFLRVAEKWQKKGRYDLTNPLELQDALEDYLSVAKHAASVKSAQARVDELRDWLEVAVGKVALAAAKVSSGRSDGESFRDLLGKYKRQINTEIKRRCGMGRDDMLMPELEVAIEVVRALANKYRTDLL